jgi:hypothetical protein
MNLTNLPYKPLEEYDSVFDAVTEAQIEPKNRKSSRIAELAQTIAETYARKNSDYGDSFGRSVERYGIIAALTRLSDKFNRFENLILSSNGSKPLVGDESVLDTLLDMATYALMTYMELENK